MDLAALVRAIPDYPKPGIVFRDVTTLFGDAEGFRTTIDRFAARYAGRGATKVAGIEARGFILGGALADRLGVGFVPLRKQGKLPREVAFRDFELEYGVDRIEMHLDAVGKEDRVILVDDVLATGGTASAAISLLKGNDATVLEAGFVIDLPVLKGKERVQALDVEVFSVISF